MNSRQLGLCLVCEQLATGVNFGVPTCAPCKAFFRRNAVKLGKIEFICHENGDCPVTFESRRICNCCRLAKCFRVGMEKSLIRSDGEKEARKQIVEQNREKRVRLSIIKNIYSIRPKNFGYLSQNRFKILSSSDQTLLTNIFGRYEQTFPETNQISNKHFPSIEYKTLHSFFNGYEERHQLLIEFFKIIPQFKILSLDDKMRLMKNHFGGMMYINEAILCGKMNLNLIISFQNIFGPNLANELIRTGERLLAYNRDPILLKLILIIRSFSSDINRYNHSIDVDRIYDDNLLIFAGQDVYVELLWRYLLSRLPSESDVVKFFNKIILDLLALQRACLAVETIGYSVENEIDQMKPLMQSLWCITDRIEDMN